MNKISENNITDAVNRNVMIVEDELLIALVIEYSLRRGGYNVFRNTCPERVLRQISDDDIDIVVMDINLKGMVNGIELAKKIEKHQDVKLLFISSFFSQANIQEIKNLNPIGCLQKPFSSQELLQVFEHSEID